MTRTISDRGGVVLSLILVIAINGLANWIPIGGQGTGDVSAKYTSLFTPAGFTFSIWGLIYLGLTLYVIYQALPSQRENSVLTELGKWFILSCAFNTSWIFAWHFEYIFISLVLMVGILISLVQCYRTIKQSSETLSLVVTLPFSIYVGWITVATIANISALQTAWDANEIGLSFVNWTLVKLAVAGAIGASVLILKKDIAYVLVIGWAAYGISAKQIETPEVSGAAFTLTLVAIILAVFEFSRGKIMKQ